MKRGLTSFFLLLSLWSDFAVQMPVLTTKVEGRGNGIKTVITNMVCSQVQT